MRKIIPTKPVNQSEREEVTEMIKDVNYLVLATDVLGIAGEVHDIFSSYEAAHNAFVRYCKMPEVTDVRIYSTMRLNRKREDYI